MIRRARIAPVALKRKNLWPGMGTLDYYGLLRQANLQNCDPRDSACVSNNVAKQAAVEDLWVSKYEQTGAPDDLKLTFTPQTAAQVKEFYNPQDIFNGGNVVDTRGVLQMTGTWQGNDPLLPPLPPKAPIVVVPPGSSSAATTPQGDKIINSSGASGSVAPRSDHPCKSIIGWDNDIGSCIGPFTVTTWGILAAVAFGIYAFGGGRGR